MTLQAYMPNGAYDEIYESDGRVRTVCEGFMEGVDSLTSDDLQKRQRQAEISLQDLGVTFAVYGHEDGIEKVWPVDLIPRIIAGDEWATVERGLVQRIRALNLFVEDCYNEQRIVRDGVISERILSSAKTYRPACSGLHPPQGVWCHITGVDLVRDQDGRFYVLEDNLRCPSGVSYVLENRELMKRTFSRVFQGLSVAPVSDYCERLLSTLLDCAPPTVTTPTAVVLTPGKYNSAYFEHTFLAQQMGVQLVQGSDLVVVNGFVHMQTTRGLQQVDVIYRRIDDDFLDPTCFRPDSCLGVDHLMDVYRAGRVTLANAPGTGIADDKAIYAYVPKIIRYYLGEDAILPNVPTYVCDDEKECAHVLANLDRLVVKPTNESGGYGILMGPQASKAEREKCAASIRKNPRNFIAQPMLSLSTVPTLVGNRLEPRHVDLRPFVLSGKDVYVLPGGLTRVALRAGSMVVNSSQGGGSKDTWVLSDVASLSDDDLQPAPQLVGEGAG